MGSFDNRITTVRSFHVTDENGKSKIYIHRLFLNDDHIECQDYDGNVIASYDPHGFVSDHDTKKKYGKFSLTGDIFTKWEFRNLKDYYAHNDANDIIFEGDILDAEVEISRMIVNGELHASS
jgi:hypothetical protein